MSIHFTASSTPTVPTTTLPKPLQAPPYYPGIVCIVIEMTCQLNFGCFFGYKIHRSEGQNLPYIAGAVF